MREITKEINHDLGVGTLTKAGVHADKQVPIAAAFSNLNNLNASGLYPVLFNAVVDLTQSTSQGASVLDQARARIAQDLGADDSNRISGHVTDTWLNICGTAPPLRPEVVSAFAEAGSIGVKASWGQCPRLPVFATDSTISTSPLLRSRRPGSITCT